MQRSLLVLALACLAGPVFSQSASDRTIVPGVRVGLIKKGMTPAALKKAYGATSVEDGTIPGPEGTTLDGATVFPNDPRNRVEVIWKVVKGRKTVEAVRIREAKSRWRTAKGIGMGTSLETLERLNGRAFTMSGFGWDYGGYIQSWRKGNLQRGMARTSVRLDPSRVEAVGNFAAISGERTISSDNSLVRKAKPIVSEILVNLDGS
ncbi:MAG TPA: hypothetical protein PLH94_03985 [Fimbriimonadaceae bacterium]|nr:hypothetical protein [Fimbriimonadaceae bacterium]